MNWVAEMVFAYQTGVADGKAGFRRGRPNDFEACYDQGYRHGKAIRYREQSEAYAKAHQAMRAYLETA